MVEFNIDTKDLKLIESLLKNNTNIDKLYSKLCTFELEGNKEQYQKHLEYLSIYLECEEKIYKEANLSIKKALSWIYLLNEKSNNKIVYRILNNLFLRIITDYNELSSLSYYELQYISKLLSIKAENTNEDTMCKCIVLKETVEKNLYYTFLNFLELYIQSTTNKELKEKLVLGKYNTLFTNPKIEKLTFSDNFNILPTPHIIEDVPKELLPLNNDLYRSVKDLISYTIANNEIHELLKISDSDYTDNEKIILSIFRKSMLRASFQIMSDEKIGDLNYGFHEYTESEKYKNEHEEDHISYNLIIHCFNEIKKDKKKRKILS